MLTRYNKPLYNKVLGMTNDFLYPSYSKTCEKEPWYNKTSLQQANFAGPWAVCYTEVPLYKIPPSKISNLCEALVSWTKINMKDWGNALLIRKTLENKILLKVKDKQRKKRKLEKRNPIIFTFQSQKED